MNAGMLRHYIEVIESSDDFDDNGERVEGYIQVFDARANVRTVRGVESTENGAVVNSTIITALMWYDARISEEQFIKWNNTVYRVKHINPDIEFKSMIITCEVFE